MLVLLDDSSSLGRLDHTNMSQQALMECLVLQIRDEDEDSDHNDGFRDAEGNFLDVREWKGVRCDTKGNIVRIWMVQKEGFIDFQWLPPSVNRIMISKSPKLRGTVHFTEFAACMQVLNLHSAELCGELHMKDLPEDLMKLELITGSFTGDVLLKDSPEGVEVIKIQKVQVSCIDLESESLILRSVEVSSCALQGTLNFQNSSPSLQTLNLSRNNLSGTIDVQGVGTFLGHLNLENNQFQSVRNLHLLQKVWCIYLASNRLQHIEGDLPPSMGGFDAKDNILERSMNLRGLPHCIEGLFMGNNKMTGSLDFPGLPNRMIEISLHTNNFTGTVNFDHLPPYIRAIELQSNRLSGSFSFEKIPESLFRIDLRDNEFSFDAIVVPDTIERFQNLECIHLEGNSIRKVVNTYGETMDVGKIQLSEAQS